MLDDLTIWHTSKHIGISARHLNEDLEKLYAYCRQWKIVINCAKTTYTIFTSNKVAKNFIFRHIQVSNLTPNSLLIFNQHVSNLKTKATKRLKLLKHLASTKWGTDTGTYGNCIKDILDQSLTTTVQQNPPAAQPPKHPQIRSKTKPPDLTLEQ